MFWLDIIIAVILGFNILRGIRNGLIMEVISISGIGVGIWAGVKYRDFVRPFWEFIPNETAVQILCFLTIMILTYFLFFLVGAMIKGIVRRTLALGWLDMLGGALIGASEVWIPVSLLFYYLIDKGLIPNLIERSFFAPFALDTARWVFNLIRF